MTQEKDLELQAIQMIKQMGLDPRRSPGRTHRLVEVLALHPNATLVKCADEWSGVRFGNANKRAGRAVKIGQTTFSYQLWAVWP